MKRNKAIAFLLILVMLISLTGCQSQEAAKETTAPSTAGTETGSSAARQTSQTPQTDGAQSPGTLKPPAGYPSGTVTWIVPAAAGAALDLPARALIEVLEAGTVVVENIAGATQTIGMAEAANRPADGYTLLSGSNAGMLIMPSSSSLAYSIDDFRHIAMLAPPVYTVVCVRAESEITNAEEWITRITSGEHFTFSHGSGSGGLGHLASLQFLPELGSTGGEFIAYNGSAEMMTALLNGEIDWAMCDADAALTRWKSGELIPIVTLNSRHFPGLEEIPCITEYGITDKVDLYVGWKWVAVRKDTPDEIVEWLKQQINQAVQNEKYKSYLNNSGLGELKEPWTEEEITETLYAAKDAYLEMLTTLGMAVR